MFFADYSILTNTNSRLHDAFIFNCIKANLLPICHFLSLLLLLYESGTVSRIGGGICGALHYGDGDGNGAQPRSGPSFCDSVFIILFTVLTMICRDGERTVQSNCVAPFSTTNRVNFSRLQQLLCLVIWVFASLFSAILSKFETEKWAGLKKEENGLKSLLLEYLNWRKWPKR